MEGLALGRNDRIIGQSGVCSNLNIPAFKIAYYRTPRMIPDLLRLFCEDTTLAKLDLGKIRIETPSYIAGKKNLHCDLVVSAPFLSDPDRKALFITENFAEQNFPMRILSSILLILSRYRKFCLGKLCKHNFQ